MAARREVRRKVTRTIKGKETFLNKPVKKSFMQSLTDLSPLIIVLMLAVVIILIIMIEHPILLNIQYHLPQQCTCQRQDCNCNCDCKCINGTSWPGWDPMPLPFWNVNYSEVNWSHWYYLNTSIWNESWPDTSWKDCSPLIYTMHYTKNLIKDAVQK